MGTKNLPIVAESATIKKVMRTIDKDGVGIAFIVNNKSEIVGVATDGDIRRAILKGVNLERPVKDILNKEPVVVYDFWSEAELREFLNSEKTLNKIPKEGVLKIPVLDKEKHIKDVIYVSKRTPQRIEIDYKKALLTPTKVRPTNKVLVIGGAGYLGSILVRKLLQKGYRARVLDNLTYGDEGIRDLYVENNFEFIKGDMRDISTVVNAIKGMDAVIHLAAIVGDSASALNPQETIEINYLSTKIVAEVCKYYQINRFIFASTCSVYGVSPTPETRINEQSPLTPASLYAEMKLKSEKGILDLVDENFSPSILRMATIYGLSPRMRFDLIVNLLTAKAVVDKKITIFGGEQWRPNLHVKDASEAYIKSLEAPINKIRGEIFNVGSNEQNYKIKEIGEMINKIIPEAEIITDKENIDRRDYNVSFHKIKGVLNYKSEYTIKDGVTEIKEAIRKGAIKDYTDDKYSNYKFLQEENRYSNEENI